MSFYVSGMVEGSFENDGTHQDAVTAATQFYAGKPIYAYSGSFGSTLFIPQHSIMYTIDSGVTDTAKRKDDVCGTGGYEACEDILVSVGAPGSFAPINYGDTYSSRGFLISVTDTDGENYIPFTIESSNPDWYAAINEYDGVLYGDVEAETESETTITLTVQSLGCQFVFNAVYE